MHSHESKLTTHLTMVILGQPWKGIAKGSIEQTVLRSRPLNVAYEDLKML